MASRQLFSQTVERILRVNLHVFLNTLGCSPRFNVPRKPQQSGLCEGLIGTLKNMISKVAVDHLKS